MRLQGWSILLSVSTQDKMLFFRQCARVTHLCWFRGQGGAVFRFGVDVLQDCSFSDNQLSDCRFRPPIIMDNCGCTACSGPSPTSCIYGHDPCLKGRKTCQPSLKILLVHKATFGTCVPGKGSCIVGPNETYLVIPIGIGR